MTEATNMIPCEEVLARLWEYLDDELPPEDEAALRAHLEVCNRCFPKYDFQRAYFTFTRRLREREHAPPALRRRLFRLILEQEAGNGGGA